MPPAHPPEQTPTDTGTAAPTTNGTTAGNGTNNTTIVVANGTRPLPRLPVGRIIAADGGLARTLAAGLQADVLVGDLDSVSPHDLEAHQTAGGRIEAFPRDKNQTDLELAIDLAEPGCNLILVGGDGHDRFDHLLGELSHVAHRAKAFASVTVHYPPSVMRILSDGQSVTLDGVPGSIISLIPFAATAYGVTATGVSWPLEGDDLRAGSTRGLSNQLVNNQAVVSVEKGTLFVVQPVVEP